MKFASIIYDGGRDVALVDSQAARVWPLRDILPIPPKSMLELIRSYSYLRPLLALQGDGLDLALVRLEAPIPRPLRNIICVGKNYAAHATEFSKSGFDATRDTTLPAAPIVFTKAPESVIANNEDIRIPHGVSDQIDYEAELAVIIGKPGRGILRRDAMSHVWGYTILNDVTARDLQKRHQQWFLAKSMDTFCPMGPWVVTADEINGAALRVECLVNGELRQDASTCDLIFDIPSLIETISAGMTLQAGDIIATGTPAGVGIGFAPPRFLRPGDRVSIRISGIGELNNSVI